MRVRSVRRDGRSRRSVANGSMTTARRRTNRWPNTLMPNNNCDRSLPKGDVRGGNHSCGLQLRLLSEYDVMCSRPRSFIFLSHALVHRALRRLH